MADTFPVRIIRERYTYGDRTIPVGAVVEVTEAQFAAMTSMTPPYAERVESGGDAAVALSAAGENIAPSAAASDAPAAPRAKRKRG